MQTRSICLAAALWAAGAVAGDPTFAQPAPRPAPQPAPPTPSPPPPSGDKVDAKSLMQSGVRLLEAKDYLGALAVFKGAYARFPSAKILLNIGTTLKLLDRRAEAANAYQQYLDSKDADPAKKAEVTSVLADLDKSVGRLEISVTPSDAEVQVNNAEWVVATSAKLARVPAGPFTVRARKDKFHPEAKSAAVALGDKATVAIDMTAIPEEKPQIITVTTEAAHKPEGPRSRFGAIAMAHLDLPRPGGAALVGVTADLTQRLRVQAQSILHKNYGAFAGAAFAILPGTFRPFLAAGFPMVFSNGPRVSVRGAGGLEVAINNKISVLAELGVETGINPEDNIIRTIFVPALGATGRL